MSGRSINPAILKPRLGFAVFALILLLCGLVMAFSASAITSISAGNDSTSYLFSQGKMALLGLALAYAIYRVIPFELWKHDKAVWVIWFACIALILATALFGVSHGGAKRWINLPLIGEIQPGEFIKVGLALVACKNIDDYDQGMMNHRMLFFRLAFLIALPIGAIYLTQSDLGTSIICFVCLIAALYFTNKPLAVIGAIIAVVGFFALINATGDGYRGERMVYLDPWNDGENGFGAGYQTIHSLYALADGGLFGVGLGNSREKFLYLPANNTDYVFAVVCEELGVIGGVAIALCFLALFYFGLKISQNCVGSFSKGLSGCLTTMLVFQAFLNIGCAISLLPMTGKPLPFFSVGGSSMLATMIILGFVLACSRASEFESPEAEYTRRRENLRVTTHAPREERSVPRGWQNASRSWQDMPWEGRGVSQSGQRVSQGWQNVSRGAQQWQCVRSVPQEERR